VTSFNPTPGDNGTRTRRRATSPGATPASNPTASSHEPAGDSRSRGRRGGRGRGPRPAGEQQAPVTRDAIPAVVVPAGDVATVLPTDTTFDALGVPAPLVEVLTASGIAAPFPIQVATLPDSLAGKDVLGRGRTGSGKTLAFSLPLVARLAASTSKRQPRRPRALVLVPTRELANQVFAVVDPLARALACQPPRSSVASGRTRRSRRWPRAWTSSSPVPGGSRT
jgi:hypothetical protein